MSKKQRPSHEIAIGYSSDVHYVAVRPPLTEDLIQELGDVVKFLVVEPNPHCTMYMTAWGEKSALDIARSLSIRLREVTSTPNKTTDEIVHITGYQSSPFVPNTDK